MAGKPMASKRQVKQPRGCGLSGEAGMRFENSPITVLSF
jgi:hypothetical protein